MWCRALYSWKGLSIATEASRSWTTVYGLSKHKDLATMLVSGPCNHAGIKGTFAAQCTKIRWSNLLQITNANVAETKDLNTWTGSICILPSEIWMAKENRASNTGMFSLREANWKLDSAVKSTTISTSVIDSEGSWTLVSVLMLIEISAGLVGGCWPSVLSMRCCEDVAKRTGTMH